VHIDAFYNSDGTLQWTKDAITSQNPTNYSYTPTSHPNGTHITQMVIARPSPLGSVTVNYDGLSRVASTVDGNGTTTTYTYDKLDRFTRVTYNGDTGCGSRSTCTDYTYDANGNVTIRIDATGTTGFTYDALNRQLTKTLPG